MSFPKEPLYGNHLGIVINRDDPESRGRVQVWIPYLSNTLHASWNKELKNKKFKHVHDSGALTPELVEELKNVLPWAECASPIFGSGTSATYNSVTGKTATEPINTLADVDNNFAFTGKIGTPNFAENLPPDSYNRLDADVKEKLGAFAGQFPNAVITSGFRAGVPRGGSPTSLHREGRAIDVRVWDMVDGKQVIKPESEIKEMVNWWATVGGATEIGYEARSSSPHLHFGFNPKKVLNPFDVGSTPQWWKEFKPKFAKGQIKQLEQPATSVAATTINQHDGTNNPNTTVKDASSANSDSGFTNGFVEKVKEWEAGKDRKDFYSVAKEEIDSEGNSVYVIGYGTPSTKGATITVPEAEKKLIQRLGELSNTLDKKLAENKVETLTQNQREALLSFAFNTGEKNLNKLLESDGQGNRRTWDEISRFMPEYTKSGNENQRAGLQKRRADELAWAGSNGSNNGEKISSNPNALRTTELPAINPPVVSAGLAGSQPSGMLSIPDAGAKVFVFFLAGDIQKPIYFASSLETETIKKMTQASSPASTFTANKREYATSTIMSSGPVSLNLHNGVSKELDGTPFVNNNFSLNADGTGISAAGVQLDLVSMNDLNENVRGHVIRESLGSSEKVFGSINRQAGENITFISGEQSDEHYEAVKKLAEITSQVQKEKLEQIKSTARSGEKVPCPLCSTSYAVDRASSFAKKAFKFIRGLIGNPPYFSYVIDVFQFLLGLILVPFTSIVPGHVLGDCGNPDCEKGQIPSPQKPIQDANKEAAEKLASKQDEIFDAEKKLGNGGSCSVVASKDVVISAGMVINNAPCYTKTVKKSVAVATQTKGADGKGSTVCPRLKSAVIDNVVYCAPTNLPGNILLRGGNSVQIVAGAAGIELNTKGKIKMNCGSIEILSSDGEMVVGSTNHTTIKGKVVTISSDDRTNEGGVEIQASNMICKGFSSTGNAGIVGGLRVDGELSIPFLNCVGQRTQTEQGSSPDQRIPFVNWGIGPAQTNDLLNDVRTVLTHYAMPGAFLNLTNIVKSVMQVYNTLYINTVIEPAPTGLYFGYCAIPTVGAGFSWGWIWNWHHNHLEDPKPHHHDSTQPKGNYYDDIQGVRNSAVEPGPIPTKARSNGQGPDGGPKTLAGCGGFGGWGGGSGGKRFNYNKMNSFGIGDQVPGFTNTRLQSSNVTFKRLPDGNIDIIVDNTKC